MNKQWLIWGGLAIVAIYVIFKLRGSGEAEVVTVPSYFPVGTQQSAGDASAARDSARVASFGILGDVIKSITQADVTKAQTQAQLEATRLQTESSRLATAGQLALSQLQLGTQADLTKLQLQNQMDQYYADIRTREFQILQEVGARRFEAENARVNKQSSNFPNVGGFGFQIPGAVYGTPPFVQSNSGGGIFDTFGQGIGNAARTASNIAKSILTFGF